MKALTPDEILALVPQQPPMRFIDALVEADAEQIIGRYTWRAEDCAGYAPGDALVPPFKIIEMAAQVGSVAWGIYHMALQEAPEAIGGRVGVFTSVEDLEFFAVARAGDTLACRAGFDGEGYFRAGKLLSRVEIQFDGGPKDGATVMTGLVAGMWVPKNASAAG